MKKVKTINCVIIRYLNEYYLLPEAAVKEVYLFKTIESQCSINSKSQIYLSHGRGCYPLQTLRNVWVQSEELHPRSKIALLYQKSDGDDENILATPFDGIPHKIEIKPNDLTWFNEEQRIAMLGSSPDSALKLMLPGLEVF
jgi:hypothetical protein